MSLILDALQKLEREKQTTPRGFLVVAPGPWAGSGRGASLVAGSLLVGLVLGALCFFTYGRWMRAEPAAPAAAPPTLAAAISAGVSASVPPGSLAPTPPVRPRSDPAPILAAPAPSTPASPALSRATSPASEGPRLQAISEQDGHPVAVIDERMVREGDEIDGMKIVRIGAAEVEIEQLGRRRVLRF